MQQSIKPSPVGAQTLGAAISFYPQGQKSRSDTLTVILHCV